MLGEEVRGECPLYAPFRGWRKMAKVCLTLSFSLSFSRSASIKPLGRAAVRLRVEKHNWKKQAGSEV